MKPELSPPQSCHTVDSDAAARLLPELQLQQVQPILHDLVGGRSSIIKRPILETEKEGEVMTSATFLRNNKTSVRVANSCCLGRGGHFLFTGFITTFYTRG